MSSFTRTSQDADTHNIDACCGEFVSASRTGADRPADELVGNVIYCYTRCATCGALWRDGFRDSRTTDRVYQGIGSQPIEFEAFEGRWEFDHIDDNKLHDGRAIAVFTPPVEYDPVGEWVDEGILSAEEAAEFADVDLTNYEKREMYVYRFSEVDPSTVSPVCVGAEYEYHPDPTVSGDGIAVEVTALEFSRDGDDETDMSRALDRVTVVVGEVCDYDGETDLTGGDTLTFTTDEFARVADLRRDPYSGVVPRPKL